MYSSEERCILNKNQLAEVICQLRFPEILKINTELPVDFQEEIRSEFPQFSRRMETVPPRGTHLPAPGISQPHGSGNVNYQFVSSDGVWRINLTSKFLSLSCNRYTCWEDFAKHLDKPLVSFIKIYNPSYFERIGLRYLNFISRKNLDLESIPFRDLIQNQYLGPLS